MWPLVSGLFHRAWCFWGSSTLKQISVVCTFLWLRNVLWSGHAAFLRMNVLRWWTLRCFHLLNVCTDVCIPVFRSLGGRTRSAIAGSHCHPMFDLLRNHQAVRPRSCTVFCSPQHEGSDFFIRFFLVPCFPKGGTDVSGPFRSSFPSHSGFLWNLKQVT